MALPSCECIPGFPQSNKLDAIYCALLEVIAGQSAGIILSQITDLDPSWIPILQAPAGDFEILAAQISNMTAFWRTAVVATPAANTYLTSNGAQALAAIPFANISVTASQISDATIVGVSLIQLAPPAGNDYFVAVSNGGGASAFDSATTAGIIANGVPITTTQTPVTSITISNGIVTGVS